MLTPDPLTLSPDFSRKRAIQRSKRLDIETVGRLDGKWWAVDPTEVRGSPLNSIASWSRTAVRPSSAARINQLAQPLAIRGAAAA